MFKRHRHQAAALGLAVAITLSVLASLDHLATQQHAGAAMARAAAPVGQLAGQPASAPRS
jgi:hypothetical protein